MLNKLLDLFKVRKDMSIGILSFCLGTISMHFIDDHVLFADRVAVLNQYKSEINNLKSIIQKQETQFEEYFNILNQKNSHINELRKVISNLQLYEQAMPEWQEALGNERKKTSQLQEQVSQITLSKKNEIKEIENNKNATEMKIAELESSPLNEQYYTNRIEQLKRIALEYQQQLLQLRQCNKQ